MLFDEHIADLVTRKYQAVRAAPEDVRFIHEVARFVRWLFEEDITRAYVLQILRSDAAEWAAYAEHLKQTEAQAKAQRDRLTALVPNYVQLEAGDAPVPGTVRAFDGVAARGDSLDDTRADLDRSPMSDSSRAGQLAAHLASAYAKLAGPAQSEQAIALRRDIQSLQLRHQYFFDQQVSRGSTSPARSLRMLLEVIRALAVPPEGVTDWMSDFVTPLPGRTVVLREKIQRDLGRLLPEVKSDLARLHVEINERAGHVTLDCHSRQPLQGALHMVREARLAEVGRRCRRRWRARGSAHLGAREVSLRQRHFRACPAAGVQPRT